MQVSIETDEDARVTKGEAPKLLTFIVKPNQLKKNTVNKIRLTIKYEDADKDLRNGSLELKVTESNGYERNYSFPLTGGKYNKKKGKFKLKINVIIGNCRWAKFEAHLVDAGANEGEAKLVKLDAAGSRGPKWGPETGSRIMNFILQDQKGRTVSLHEHWGKVIFLDFSATFCDPCKAQAARAQQLYRKYKKQGFMMITVLSTYEVSNCREWANTFGLKFPILAGGGFTHWDVGGGGTIPHNFVIDQTMIVHYNEHGYDEEEIVAKIEEVLERTPEVFNN